MKRLKILLDAKEHEKNNKLVENAKIAGKLMAKTFPMPPIILSKETEIAINNSLNNLLSISSKFLEITAKKEQLLQQWSEKIDELPEEKQNELKKHILDEIRGGKKLSDSEIKLFE
jgi:hypothetical protein